jgi:hypothetical protein
VNTVAEPPVTTWEHPLGPLPHPHPSPQQHYSAPSAPPPGQYNQGGPGYNGPPPPGQYGYNRGPNNYDGRYSPSYQSPPPQGYGRGGYQSPPPQGYGPGGYQSPPPQGYRPGPGPSYQPPQQEPEQKGRPASCSASSVSFSPGLLGSLFGKHHQNHHQNQYAPPAQVIYEQAPQKKHGMGLGTKLALGGGGLLAGALIGEAIEDHIQNEEIQAYDAGQCMSSVASSLTVIDRFRASSDRRRFWFWMVIPLPPSVRRFRKICGLFNVVPSHAMNLGLEVSDLFTPIISLIFFSVLQYTCRLQSLRECAVYKLGASVEAEVIPEIIRRQCV